ncbi:MAG: sulfatase-like hydrolase/transferase, partial [Pseudomonadota bacterium]
MAARGVRFSNAYTPSPICVPARASFATGLYPHQTGHWDNSMPYRGTPPSWGHRLQEKGIRVESIGKLHYRDPEDPVGFEAMHVPMMVKDGVGMVFASARKEEERVDAPGRMLGKYIGPGESTYTRYDQEVVAQTQDWLNRSAQSDQPWCLYVGLVAPHFPLVCPERFFNMYPPGTLPPVKAHPDTGYRRHPWVELQSAFDNSEAKFRDEAERLDALSAYFGLISWLDYNVGLILTALDASGQMERTTIVYTSDHGDNAGARGMWGKSNMYQESAAVPLILAGPSVAAHGPGPVVCDTAVSLVDLTQ